MRAYDIELRLSGNLLHVVPKQGVTASEILVLRLMHGSDAVANIRPLGEVERTDRAEFERLSDLYNGGSIAAPEEGAPRRISLETIFPGAVKRLLNSLADLGEEEPGAAPPPLATDPEVSFREETVSVAA